MPSPVPQSLYSSWQIPCQRERVPFPVKTLKENEARRSASSASEAETSTRRSGGEGNHSAPVTPEGNTTEAAERHGYERRSALQSRQGKAITEFFFPSFPHDPGLCPVVTLKAYEDRTAPYRGDELRLFLALIKPYKAVTSSTILDGLNLCWKRQELIHLCLVPTRYDRHRPQQLQTWGLRLMIY